jgi:hypothetical protein
MKILEVKRIEYFFVTTDDTDYRTYRRSVDGNTDDWEVLMGDSWESYNDANELEQLFQRWLDSLK